MKKYLIFIGKWLINIVHLLFIGLLLCISFFFIQMQFTLHHLSLPELYEVLILSFLIMLAVDLDIEQNKEKEDRDKS